MNRLLSVLLVDRRGEEAEVQRRKGEYILSKGFQTAILRHFDKYYVRIPRTPVPHLFKTNGVPSPEDLVKMRTYIHQLQRIVLSTETSPSSIKRYKGNKAYGIATEHSRLLQQTTIRNLPPEIIQRIVYFSLSPSFVRKECLPWVASWVCSSWRRTVLGHHHLWGVLPKIDLRSSFVRPAKKRIIQELLRRSGDASLSVDIEDIGFIGQNHSYHQEALELLLEHSHRYVDVRLNLNSNIFSSIVMPTLSRWRRLRRLSLKIDCIYPGHSAELPRFDLRRLTSLKSIEVPGRFWSQILLPPHTTALTTYGTGGANLSMEDWLRTLDLPGENRASSVTKLVLPARRQLFLGEEFSPVLAPRVTEVVLYDHSSYSGWNRGPIVLEGFVTPCLHTLKISFASISTLESLASRLSQATLLTTLHLLCQPESHSSPRDVGLPMSSLSKLIDNTPNIVNLKISEDPSSHPLIHLLGYLKKPRKDWDPYPLPRLKHLTILARWDIRPSVLDLLHYVAITRMERPPPFEDTHFDKLETLEVVLTGAGVLKSQSTPHATQDRVRGDMEGWGDSEGYGGPASHLSLFVFAEEIRDFRRRVARLLQSVGEPPLTVFAELERCLGKIVEGLGDDGPMSFKSIEDVYISGIYYDLRDLQKSLESGRGWRMSGFSILDQTSTQLASGILENWRPRLAELASRTRWFNLGVDSLIFLRLDDPRRLENETRGYLVDGFPLFNNGSRYDVGLPPLPAWDAIRMEF